MSYASTSSLVVSVFLFALSIGQLCRFIFGISVVAGGIEIPVWPSALAALLLAALGVWLFKERKSGSMKTM